MLESRTKTHTDDKGIKISMRYPCIDETIWGAILSLDISVGNQQHSIVDLVPKSWVLLAEREDYEIFPGSNTITLGYIVDNHFISTTLHEVGHAIWHSKHSHLLNSALEHRSQYLYSDSCTVDDVEFVLSDEALAWEFALNTIRIWGLDDLLGESTQKRAASLLGSYVDFPFKISNKYAHFPDCLEYMEQASDTPRAEIETRFRKWYKDWVTQHAPLGISKTVRSFFP